MRSVGFTGSGRKDLRKSLQKKRVSDVIGN